MTDNSSFLNIDDTGSIDSQTYERRSDVLDDISGVDPVEVLVGEGKKFKSVSDLAKGKLAADAHIARLERENAEKDRKLQEAATLDRLMSELKLSKPASKTSAVANDDEDEVESFSRARIQEIDPEDIAKRVLETLETKQKQAQQEQNQKQVAEELKQVYGVDWRNKVVEWAKENDVPLSTLDSLARQSPKGFFKTLGINSNQRETPSLFNTKVNTNSTLNSGTSSKVKTFKDYSKMRKENPDLYRDPRIQMEMFKAAQTLGDDFYR